MVGINLTEGIAGVYQTRLTHHADSRGWLAELFRLDQTPIELDPAMCYMSITYPFFTRGPHEHKEQSDHIVFFGTFKITLWDNRPDSVTYKNKVVLETNTTILLSLVIPPGVVHAYQNIDPQADGLTINFPNRLYKGTGKEGPVDEIRHEEDPNSPFKI